MNWKHLPRELPGLLRSGVAALLSLSCWLAAWSAGVAATSSMDLHGTGWTFALDPVCRGETVGWHTPAADWDGKKPHPRSGWDEVKVPHDFLTDPRYAYTGVAWYRRSFPVPAGALEGRGWRLQFDTVFQRCRIWINGIYVGTHEGGYTPFEFSVGRFLRAGRENLLVIEVDNRVKFRALPGARTGTTANAGQYPWLNYGGILGGVRLVSHDSVWVASQKIDTRRAQESWRVSIRATIENDSDQPRSGRATASLSAGNTVLIAEYAVAPRASTSVTLTGAIPANAVQTWDLATPALYQSRVALEPSGSSITNSFGFRNIEIRDAQLLLNNRPVRLAGANRARGHPVHGGIDPDDLVARDLKMMKDAGLVFARLQHTPPGRNLLEWADRNGMLLVLEVGMWGYTSPDQASPELRRQFQAEMRELCVLAQNHPSVIAWSLGNEYESWTPEGVQWTRDMARFMKELDPTRFVTFAALGTALRKLREDPASGEHAFDYVDYISANFYFKPEQFAEFVDPVHVRWPLKPVAITEFGLRADQVADEKLRLAHFDRMLGEVRTRSWICGLSFWCFNDYASRYPGTGADGYRRWGLVDEHRTPRGLYQHVAPLLKKGLGSSPGS